MNKISFVCNSQSTNWIMNKKMCFSEVSWNYANSKTNSMEKVSVPILRIVIPSFQYIFEHVDIVI